MRESAEQGPPQDRGASVDDIRRSIESLTDPDTAKLMAYARNRIRWIGLSASYHEPGDLLHEAMMSVLEAGRRHWNPEKVTFTGFLIGAMRSISTNWARKGSAGKLEIAERNLIRLSDTGEEVESPLELAASQRPDPEEALLPNELQTKEQLIEEIKNLFRDHPLASLIIDGWGAHMKGPEIIEALDIDKTEYDTAVRLIRRRTTARWPKGMPDVR